MVIMLDVVSSEAVPVTNSLWYPSEPLISSPELVNSARYPASDFNSYYDLSALPSDFKAVRTDGKLLFRYTDSRVSADEMR